MQQPRHLHSSTKLNHQYRHQFQTLLTDQILEMVATEEQITLNGGNEILSPHDELTKYR